MLEFRKITDFERGTLERLLKDAYAFNPEYERYRATAWRDFDNFFYDNPSIGDRYCFITTLDGEAIGLVSWDPRNQPEYAQIGENGLCEKYKGHGYGTAQMREAVARIFRDGAKKIIVTTDDDLIAAQHMYVSAGFIEVGRRKKTTEPTFVNEFVDYEQYAK